jgi:Cupredoxin-like domain
MERFRRGISKSRRTGGSSGDTPAEFESNELRKEKVLAPKTTSILVFRTLDPGEYPFFDDFHPDAPQAVLIAK